MKASSTRLLIVSAVHVSALVLAPCNGYALDKVTNAYACSGTPTPATDLANIGGSVSVTGTCFFTGDLVLDGSGTISIVAEAATVNISGNLVLSKSTSLSVVGGVFRLANQFVFQYSISTSDSATFEMRDARLSTNDGSVAGTTTSTYSGSGASVLKFTNVSIDTMHSWLLATANNNSSIIVSNSQAPVEIYPHDSATISISGPDSNLKVWLDFTNGLNASIDNLPDGSAPYTFSIGAGTPATASVSTNARFQVDIVNARASLGFISHPGSSVTVTTPRGPTGYNYYFDDPIAPIDINGGFVVSQGVPISTTFSDSGRTLKLVEVPLPPIAWQVYSQATSGTSQPVTITGSTSDPARFVTLNEVGAFNGGNLRFNTVTFLWAVIAAVGSANISITNSQIASQSILAMDTGRISITDSTIYGSVFQARGNGMITLANTRLLRVGDVRNPPSTGFPSLAQNPTMPDTNAYPIFLTDTSGGTIVAASIDAFAAPLEVGSTVTFRGDAFVQSHASSSCTFKLSYLAPGSATFTPLSSGVCPRLAQYPGDSLGSLDTAALAAGTYTAKLEVYLDGVLSVTAPRQFTLTEPATSGAQIVFTYPGVPGDGNAQEIFTINLDGSKRTQITHDGLSKFLPHFSPDGTRLVYTKFLVGDYGHPQTAQTDVFVYDFASAKETQLTHTGQSIDAVWSPDGQRIAFDQIASKSLSIINADGSNAHLVSTPSGTLDDLTWSDFAWSSDDWILFVVAQNTNNCFKTRLDKIRSDGSARTRVTDGGPNCTPNGMEQSGDADPGFSADGKTIYSSRGFPRAPAGLAGQTERRLYSFSSDAWTPGKVETDRSLASAPDCIEGVPKGSPDGTRVLLFRICAGEAHSGVTLTDTAGSYRTWITDGFGADWNASASSGVNLDQHGLTGSWYNPVMSGQGFEIEVYPDLSGPGQGVLFAGWFTYDVTAAGGRRWYGLTGNVSRATPTATLQIFAVEGGNLNAPPAVGANGALGQATIQFSDCNTGSLAYNFTDGSGRSGNIPLSRLTPNVTCSPIGDNGNAPSDYLLSGNWYDPNTSGQGFIFDFSPAINNVFAAWYTFIPNGRQTSGATREDWFTLQSAQFVDGSTSLDNIPIIQSSGGVFDYPMSITSVQVGTANIVLHGCNAMTLSYTFSSGDNANLSGTINLQRVGPTPTGCSLE